MRATRSAIRAGDEVSGRFSGGWHKGALASGSDEPNCHQQIPKSSWQSGFDWYTFVCAVCGFETSVGRSPEQSVDDFALMVSWMYGDPPVCTVCLHPERGLDA